MKTNVTVGKRSLALLLVLLISFSLLPISAFAEEPEAEFSQDVFPEEKITVESTDDVFHDSAAYEDTLDISLPDNEIPAFDEQENSKQQHPEEQNAQGNMNIQIDKDEEILAVEESVSLIEQSEDVPPIMEEEEGVVFEAIVEEEAFSDVPRGAVSHSGSWGDLEWTLDNEGTLIISGTGSMENLSYSDSQAWHPYNTDIKEVVLESNVASIGDYAFSSCKNLESITFLSKIETIGMDAFSYCTSLTNITIPSSVANIGRRSFAGCSNLTDINILPGVQTIDSYAFIHCTSLSNITIPSSVTSIGENAFFYCESLSKISIPSGVTSIGIMTFYGCSKLKSIDLPPSVKSIG